MEYKVIIKKRFANNLLTMVVFLEKEWGKKVADEFVEKITASISVLKSHPYIGAPSKKIAGLRGLSITKHIDCLTG